MLKNYFIIAFRNLLRYKSYSMINIVGLAIGLTCALLILLWVQDELSYDNYNEKVDSICQAYLKFTKDDNIGYQPSTSPAIAGILKNEYPEILETVRMSALPEMVFKVEDKIITESLGNAADPSIFDVFTLPFVFGNSETALVDPFSIILTQSTAKKYFGETNPLGKTIRVNNKFDFMVKGVIEDLPSNTYRQFDFIVPFSFLKEIGQDIIGSPFFPCSYLTYTLLKDNTSYEMLSDKIAKRIFSKGEEISFEIVLIPLKDVYTLDSGSNVKIALLSGIALFILIIACVNFMNLVTARASARAKEIAIRKTTGATRKQVAGQFLGESILFSVIAVLIAFVLTRLLLSGFNSLTAKTIAINYFDPTFMIGILGLILLTGILGGLYPALYLSNFHPTNILRQKGRKRGRFTLRKTLIIFQFVLSIGFISCTFIFYHQTEFIHNFNLGINKDNILYVRLDGDILSKFESIKNELKKNPNITSITSASNLPIAITSGAFYQWGVNDGVGRRMSESSVSYDYVETFGIQMAAGRFYNKEYSNDINESIVVNEAAIKKIGINDPVGKPFYYDDRNYTLIGVVKDFHNNSPWHTVPTPLTFRLNPSGNQYLFVKINPEISDTRLIVATVDYIKSVCNSFSPERPLYYSFLSDFSFQQERVYEVVKLLLFISTILTILISCLGLFGLSAFVNEQRIKEVGIRKALGASTPNILMMLIKDFGRWVLIANLIAWPLAWLIMNKWLEDFAYRINISWWMFALSGLIALVIAVATVSFQAIKTVMANPVESLKYE